MTLKKVLLVFLPWGGLLFMLSCSPSAQKQFDTLKQLHGSWKSSGTVITHERWTIENDSLLLGQQFAKRKENILVLERYRLERSGDQIFYTILSPSKKQASFPLVDVSFGEFTFENKNASYPNRLILEFEDDSIFVLRRENMRGNKIIEFKMKRTKE